MRVLMVAALLCGASVFQAQAQAQAQALAPRDINGDQIVDAYYDAALDITWLAETRTLGQPMLNWSDAMSWAGALSVHGVSGWRLPKMLGSDVPGFCSGGGHSGGPCGWNPGAGSSELAHLYYNTLGNQALLNEFGQENFLEWVWTEDGNYEPVLSFDGIGWVKPHPFVGLDKGDSFWMANGADEGYAYFFGGGTGEQTMVFQDLSFSGLSIGYTGSELQAAWKGWAVRDGDIGAVSPVPEPSTWALLAAGFAAVVALARRRRPRQAA